MCRTPQLLNSCCHRLVLYSKYQARLARMHKLTAFQCKNLFKVRTNVAAILLYWQARHFYKDNVLIRLFFLSTQVDLANYDAIIIFGVDTMMPLIQNKVQEDCVNRGKQATVIACRFPLPGQKPIASFGSGVDEVWLYHFPSWSEILAPTTSPLAAPARTILWRICLYHLKSCYFLPKTQQNQVQSCFA